MGEERKGQVLEDRIGSERKGVDWIGTDSKDRIGAEGSGLDRNGKVSRGIVIRITKQEK